MGVLQLDTINVVSRSPYFVLFSRLGAYDQVWLEELLAEGQLFEYWAHAMCFIPMEDYPLFGSLMEHGQKEQVGYWRNVGGWLERHRAEADHALKRIAREGGLKSSDFKSEQKRGGGWWDIKVEKLALEHLFVAGQLAISRREKFQRVYDLRERVIPAWDSRQVLPREQVHLELLRKSSFALGVATEPWLRDYYRLKMIDSRAAIETLEATGELVRVSLEGEPAWVHRDLLPVLRKALNGKLVARHTALLSPFDPLVWHRARASELFGFDYLIECYTVEAKRTYGSFHAAAAPPGRAYRPRRRQGPPARRRLRAEVGAPGVRRGARR
jgi:uncharacterized protein YcaQ